MVTELKWIERIKLGHAVPSRKLIDRRTKGLQAIRQRCLRQLMSVARDDITHSLVLRWHRRPEYITERTVLSDSFELTFYGASRRVSGLFPDLWILCYPEDPDVYQKVEEEIARMCQELVNRS